MPSPFPGMDPYLESPALWPDVHHNLISEIQRQLNPRLRPRYVARVEVRVYVSDEDDEIEEARVEIQEVATKNLVTVIEVLSPTNKIKGSRGRASFMQKRQEALAANVHWVEIDLLRTGVATVQRPGLEPSDYRVVISSAEDRSQARYWPIGIRQPLPTIGIPLRGPDPDVPLELGEVLKAAYEQGAYDLSIDYRQKPTPPLEKDDAVWAERLLQDARASR